MADRTLVLAIFGNEAAADNAAAALKDTGLTSTDAIGVLAVDATGKLKEEKVGARSTGKGAGIGAALFLLGPAALGVGLIGGAAAGALHHKGLGLTDSDRERIGRELTNGKAAVGVLTPFNESSMISVKLGELGGAPEEHTVSDLRPVSKPARGSRRTSASDAGRVGRRDHASGEQRAEARTAAGRRPPGRGRGPPIRHRTPVGPHRG
jgi:uncharacterized membrane protein